MGVACGAGMLSLGIALTAMHLITLFVVAPLIRKLPDPDRKRLARITYTDGGGVLRQILAVATSAGFSSTIENSRRRETEDKQLVVMDIRFHGRFPVRDLVPEIVELPGVVSVSITGGSDDADDEHEDYD